jgi:hypothetical protein
MSYMKEHLWDVFGGPDGWEEAMLAELPPPDASGVREGIPPPPAPPK